MADITNILDDPAFAQAEQELAAQAASNQAATSRKSSPRGRRPQRSTSGTSTTAGTSVPATPPPPPPAPPVGKVKKIKKPKATAKGSTPATTATSERKAVMATTDWAALAKNPASSSDMDEANAFTKVWVKAKDMAKSAMAEHLQKEMPGVRKWLAPHIAAEVDAIIGAVPAAPSTSAVPATTGAPTPVPTGERGAIVHKDGDMEAYELNGEVMLYKGDTKLVTVPAADYKKNVAYMTALKKASGKTGRFNF